MKSAEFNLFLHSGRATPQADTTGYMRRFFSKYYDQNGRHFPWREERTSAYHLLVAEILLKQTKANDVGLVWPRIIRRYPTPLAMMQACIPSLLRILKPLGLQRQRAIALTSMSKDIIEVFSGKVPKGIEDLLALPYVGLYSACAVACFCYGIRVPIVDVNILRVLARLTGNNFGRDLRRNHDVWALARTILPRKRFAEHNYGLLDFSALVCTAQSPACTRCSLCPKCVYALSKIHKGG